MTADDKRGLDAAVVFLSASKECADHLMRYLSYEADAERFASFIVTGHYPDLIKEKNKL